MMSGHHGAPSTPRCTSGPFVLRYVVAKVRVHTILRNRLPVRDAGDRRVRPASRPSDHGPRGSPPSSVIHRRGLRGRDDAGVANPAVAEYRAEVGERVRFESRTDADALVETLDAEGGPRSTSGASTRTTPSRRDGTRSTATSRWTEPGWPTLATRPVSAPAVPDRPTAVPAGPVGAGTARAATIRRRRGRATAGPSRRGRPGRPGHGRRGAATRDERRRAPSPR